MLGIVVGIGIKVGIGIGIVIVIVVVVVAVAVVVVVVVVVVVCNRICFVCFCQPISCESAGPSSQKGAPFVSRQQP